MSNDSGDSGRTFKKRTSWRALLSRKHSNRPIVETIERRTQQPDNRSEGDNETTSGSNRKSKPDSKPAPRTRGMDRTEKAGGIDDEDETTGEIMIDLEEARKALNEAIKKDEK